MGKNIVILGASGYTGAELVRLIAGHSDINIVGLSAERKAGQKMGEVFPHLCHMDLPQLVKIDELSFENVDLVFCALPHATSQAVIRELPDSVKVVDLSADFRLRDGSEYTKWYGLPHDAPDCKRSLFMASLNFTVTILPMPVWLRVRVVMLPRVSLRSVR